MKNIELYSPAKINLFLDIFGKRNDGYHDIITVFEKIDLCDTIKLTELPEDRIVIESDSKDIPRDEANLAYQAALILKEVYSIFSGVKINIKKNIPVAAGMGGGSSNAATVLRGLAELWGLTLNESEFCELAQDIGADVPFFIFNHPFALGMARGDEISPIKSSLSMWHLIITPPEKVLTKDIYDSTSLNLTATRPDVKMLVHAIRENDLKGIKAALHNALEPVVTKKVRDISRTKDFFKKMGFDAVMVTGSGPTIFVLVDTEQDAEALKKQFIASLPGDAVDKWGVFVAKTLTAKHGG